MVNSVSATDLARIASIPASATSAAPSSTPAIDRTGGVPTSQPAIPSRRRNTGRMSNWSACANQPSTGGRIRPWSRGAT